MHAKNEIVAVARGYYASPLLIALSERAVRARLMETGPVVAEIPGNSPNLQTDFGSGIRGLP